MPLQVCPVGKYKAEPELASTATCTVCPPGFTTNGTGQTSCESELPFLLPLLLIHNNTLCTACLLAVGNAPTTYQQSVLILLSLWCCPPTAVLSAECLAGYYGPSCLPAPKGTWSGGGFRDDPATTFANCSTGFTTVAEASTLESDCNREFCSAIPRLLYLFRQLLPQVTYRSHCPVMKPDP